jgi:fatty-acyl-CoA synthase
MLQGFSLTEASAAATILPGHDAERKLGSAGLPIVHGSIVVVDEQDEPCPPGVVGEIVVGGPQVMAGYWGKPDASADALRGGRLHTGDLGHLDEEGYLYVVDRAKDMLISGGLNVYPAEIERVLAGIHGLVEVAVIGVPDERWGETPAVIAYTGGEPLEPDQVLGACDGVLADYKVPRYLVVRDEPLPRNMSGKVLKRELRVEYADLPSTATPIR